MPDLSVLVVRSEEYRTRHPNVDDTFLLIEVSDSSLSEDQVRKSELYAAVGIREYWLCNLIDNQLEVYRDPYLSLSGEGKYRIKLTYTRTQRVAPLAFPECEIDLSKILPR